jgi:hypothetical protein
VEHEFLRVFHRSCPSVDHGHAEQRIQHHRCNYEHESISIPHSMVQETDSSDVCRSPPIRGLFADTIIRIPGLTKHTAHNRPPDLIAHAQLCEQSPGVDPRSGCPACNVKQAAYKPVILPIIAFSHQIHAS